MPAPQERGYVPVPPDSWLVPGRVDAVLFDDNVIAALPERAPGYVIGRLLRTDFGSSRRLTVPDGRGGYVDIRSGPLRSYPLYAMPAVVFICFLVAAGTSSARFSVCLQGRHYRRWMFLGAKVVLLVFIGFFRS